MMTSSDEAFARVNAERDRVMGIGVVDDPYPRFHELQATCPAHRGTLSGEFGFEGTDGALFPGKPHVTVYSYELAEAVLKDTDTFSSAWYAPQLGSSVGRSILQMDEPEHQQHRVAIQWAFSKTEMTWWETDYVRPACDHHIDQFVERGRADLYAEFCVRIPIRVIAMALGLPTNDLPWFHTNAVKLTAGGTKPDDAAIATREIEQLLRPLVSERRAHPGRDLISVMATAEIKDGEGGTRPLADQEILTFCKLLLPAGANTTYRSLGLLLTKLFQDLALLQRVREDRSLIPDCVEELLRLEHSTSLVGRVCTRDTELGGVSVPAGTVVLVSLGAANHDPARWEDPETFDIDRPPVANIAFGWGFHRCVGLHLARMELRVALNALLDRLLDLRPDPDYPLSPISGLMFRAPEHVRAVWTIDELR
jgi:cytochrome P450